MDTSTSVHTDEIIKIYRDLLVEGWKTRNIVNLIHQYGICQKVYDYHYWNGKYYCDICYTKCDCCHTYIFGTINTINDKNVCDSEVCLETITINMQSKLTESLKQVTELSNALVKIKFTKKDEPKKTVV